MVNINILQDGNTPCHGAKIVTEWKDQNKTPSMKSPPQSSDLNLIENLRGDVKRKLRNIPHREML